MTDREKVIECLWGISAYFRESFDAMSGTNACELFRQWSDAAEHAIALLKAQESAVPVVVHGRWKKRKTWACYVCSECSFEGNGATNYCPNCGAKNGE